jgi:hypothetical protein
MWVELSVGSVAGLAKQNPEPPTGGIPSKAGARKYVRYAKWGRTPFNIIHYFYNNLKVAFPICNLHVPQTAHGIPINTPPSSALLVKSFAKMFYFVDKKCNLLFNLLY